MNWIHSKRKYWHALKKVWLIDISRIYPLAIFATCYIRKTLPDRVALHRQLWWRTRYKLPVIMWLPLEFARWINWRLWYASYLIAKSVLKHGQLIEAQFGISIQLQRLQITYWAKKWMVHPDEAYLLGLYNFNRDGLNCIFGGEMQPYHRLLNELRSVEKSDYKLLADKTKLSTLMQSVGIPMVETFRVSQGDYDDLILALQKNAALFCKLRSGSRGESAFRAEQSVSGMMGQTLCGRNLDDENAVQSAWQELTRKGEVLIQPYMKNHPDLEALSPGCDAITLRVISKADESGVQTWFGLLYVQAPGDKEEKEYYLLNVDITSGVLSDDFHHWQTKQEKQSGVPVLEFLAGRPMPYWDEIKQHSELAHAQIPRVWGIAWDWVITPDGPKLLEGNSGWDLSALNELGVNFFDVYRDRVIDAQSSLTEH